MAMQHLQLIPVLGGSKEEIPAADKMIPMNASLLTTVRQKLRNLFAVWIAQHEGTNGRVGENCFFPPCGNARGQTDPEQTYVKHALTAERRPGYSNRRDCRAARCSPGRWNTPVQEEFIWLHFVDNLPPGYDLARNNLQSSKKTLTRAPPSKMRSAAGTMFRPVGKGGR